MTKPVSVTSASAGPYVRWGTSANLSVFGLGFLLLVALIDPSLAKWIISSVLELVGAIALTAYFILQVEAARLALLRLLLKWRDWAYIPRSSISRFYLGLTAHLGGTKPKLFSLQKTLPSLPVPSLANTCEKYLDSVQPLLSEEEFNRTQDVVKDFLQSPLATKLQTQLLERAKHSETSWLLEWWEKYAYLSSRRSLCIFSNWYGLDRIDPLLRSQTARAANLIHGLMKFKEMLDKQTLEPNRVQGTVPLCMWQYSRIFGTVRVPGVEQDELKTFSNSKHIVVISKNRIFKVDLYLHDGPLTPRDIQCQLNRILEETNKVNPDDEPDVAALTSEDRNVWAEIRDDLLLMDEENKKSIEAIETALFVVVLDEDSPQTVEELGDYGLHRKGKSIWYDKNFNLIGFNNGRFVCNVDHTWADASVMVHVFDFIFSFESSVDHWIKNDPKDLQLAPPTQLKWNLTPDLLKKIQVAKLKLQELAKLVELQVLKFQSYGKGLIKKLNMSPDAFVQMAIQLAYYRIHKESVLTYESAATVRFLHGRTETVRSCSNESKAFVLAMEDEKLPETEKFKLLKLATKKHVRTMREATNGDGIDRHLFGLRVLSSMNGQIPEIFKDKAYNLEFKLSTSQTPATGMLGGGFTPLAQDGYAVSYVVAEDRLWFHISTFNTCPTTSAAKFCEVLRKTLVDMHDMCFACPELQHILSQRTYRIQRLE